MSKRRPNGDGTIRKRPDGRWEARIVVGHKKNGMPIYKSVFGKTQSEATVKLHTMIDAFRGVDLTEDCMVTLNGWLDRWLAYMQKIVRPTTLKKYVFYADAYVRPYLGDKKISAVTVTDVQRLYNKLQKSGRVNSHPQLGHELSGNTVRAVHMMLHEALEMAVNERIIASNPTDGTTIPKLIVNEMKVWNSGLLKRFLSAIEADPLWHDFFYTACMTGLRRGELCGLRWEDFDETNGRLRVRHAVIIMPGGRTDSRRTENRNRNPGVRPSAKRDGNAPQTETDHQIGMDLPATGRLVQADQSQLGIPQIQVVTEKERSAGDQTA